MIITGPWLHKAYGSAHGMTLKNWNELTVASGKISRMTNPNTLGQQKTRKKRRIIGRIYEGLGSWLQLAVEKKVYGQSKFSQVLMKVNDYVQVATDLTVTAQYEQFPYSIGSLDTVAAGSSVAYTNGEVKVELQPNHAQSSSQTDEVYIIEFNTTTGQSKVYATGETRPTTTPLTITYPPQTAGTGQRYVYVVFISADQTKSSNTVSIGDYRIT